ncbi:hypothetical protein Tsubulata_029430 [Turnera subulata]|uniref:Uncharacterized protein n=1 Tax=Turnera subulata TaxID=218843 RepID=A0A9Q0GK74_9ROSI|nr:hypothetical protein Tsubulata_029430 [Turnera subulata]
MAYRRKRLAEVVAMVVEAHRKGYSGGTHNRKKGAKKKKVSLELGLPVHGDEDDWGKQILKTRYVTRFGAVGDGVTLNTKAFQNAIPSSISIHFRTKAGPSFSYQIWP